MGGGESNRRGRATGHLDSSQRLHKVYTEEQHCSMCRPSTLFIERALIPRPAAASYLSSRDHMNLRLGHPLLRDPLPTRIAKWKRTDIGGLRLALAASSWLVMCERP